MTDTTTYSGPATLTTSLAAEPIALAVDLRIRSEQEPGGEVVLWSWFGTATADAVVPVPYEECTLTLPSGRSGTVHVLEADDVLELQGSGPAPWGPTNPPLRP